ncbi:MAG: thioredoxin family protein [Dermatophilaceae bacterium]
MLTTRAARAVVGVAVLFAVGACGTNDADSGTAAGTTPSAAASPTASVSVTASASPTASATSSSAGGAAATTTAGAYLTKAEYEGQMAAREGTKVVLFFHAPWCPNCKATEKSIDADGVPDGLTVVKVDFDSETDLRKEYGITQQHTFVQVDSEGTELAKWTGAKSGAEILEKTV